MANFTSIVSDKKPAVIVDCNGVGYETGSTMSTFFNLTTDSTQVVLYICGARDYANPHNFGSEAGDTAFGSSSKISGVGPRTALSVLSA